MREPNYTFRQRLACPRPNGQPRRNGTRCAAPEDSFCNVSLRARRTPEALIYDVRALRPGIGAQRAMPHYVQYALQSPSAMLPVCLSA
jgi:hypothetical protein